LGIRAHHPASGQSREQSDCCPWALRDSWSQGQMIGLLPAGGHRGTGASSESALPGASRPTAHRLQCPRLPVSALLQASPGPWPGPLIMQKPRWHQLDHSWPRSPSLGPGLHRETARMDSRPASRQACQGPEPLPVPACSLRGTGHNYPPSPSSVRQP
jgi:hypothetical protein